MSTFLAAVCQMTSTSDAEGNLRQAEALIRAAAARGAAGRDDDAELLDERLGGEARGRPAEEGAPEGDEPADHGVAVERDHGGRAATRGVVAGLRLPLEHEDAPVLRRYSIGELRTLLGGFSTVDIVPERFPVKSRLHKGWKGALYNGVFVGAFNALRALSCRNEEPERASRPFDLDRDGFVISEGAGIMVLESLEHARGRGAKVLAEIVGYGATDDAYHYVMPDPDGEGAYRCMKHALEDAGIEPARIGYINAHGTSTDLNDKMETKAIRRLFGSAAEKVSISSTRRSVGVFSSIEPRCSTTRRRCRRRSRSTSRATRR